MNKVIIALDYHPGDEKVAEAGMRVARSMAAEVVLVHVMADPAWYAAEYSPIMGYTGSYTDGVMSVYSDLKQEASQFLHAAKLHLGDDDIRCRILEGEVAESLLNCCEDEQAELLILGTHRHTGLDKFFLHDVNVHVIRHSKIPVLTVPVEDIARKRKTGRKAAKLST